VVRVCEPMMDAVPPDQFNAAADRHVAQRNIAVVTSSSPAHIDMALDLGWQLQAGNAEIEVEAVEGNAMDWLKLYAGSRSVQFSAPVQHPVFGLLPAMPRESRRLDVSHLHIDQRASLLRRRESVQRGCEPLSMQFHASISDMHRGEAQVLRVRQRLNNIVVGGYTVVLIGR
jgi:hypothetical protein